MLINPVRMRKPQNAPQVPCIHLRILLVLPSAHARTPQKNAPGSPSERREPGSIKNTPYYEIEKSCFQVHHPSYTRDECDILMTSRP